MRRRRWNRYAIEVAALKVLRPLGIAFFVVITVFPFYYMLLLSVRDISEIIESPGSIIVGLGELSTDAYERVLKPTSDGGEGFLRFLLNSLLLAAGTVVVTLAVSILGAYAVSRLEFFGRRAVHFLFLSVYLFPAILLAIPLFVAFSKMGLRGELWVLVIVYVAQTLPICVYMLRNYFETVPVSLEEAGGGRRRDAPADHPQDHVAAGDPGDRRDRAVRVHDRLERVPVRAAVPRRGAAELDGVAGGVAAHEHRDAGHDVDGRVGDPHPADHRAVPVRRAADDGGPHPGRREGMSAQLRETAEAVLAANWTGGSTVPSRRQYPHQWGWDAAYIAIGWSSVDPARAAAELESLLRGQWPDGRVPHIVFHPGVPDDAYFPGPAFWDSGVDGVATSGLTQPPLHARAALEVARRSGDDGVPFLRRVFSRLAAQHEYLAARRDAGGGGLAAIVHPWESGLDNSPAWDAPLAAVQLPPEGVEPYQRRDRDHVDAAERPSDAAYDRFVHLACAYRDGTYADDGQSQFLVEDPLFNAIWLWSTHALAEIAAWIGEDPGPHREAAARIHSGLMERLWDGSRFLPRDLRAGRLIEARTVLSLAPLLDPDLGGEVATAVAGELASPHFAGPSGLGVASYDILGESFEPRRYWRGPIWANLNWLLSRGLRQQGFEAQAHRLERTTLELISSSGMREYYDPLTGEGLGAHDFSWTAAAVIDILQRAG